MKGMVFAAGIGSRLKNLTQNAPKCLMKVGGRTMLEIVIERLKEVGVTEIMINLHHLPDMITRFVLSKNNFDISVSFSHEAMLLDTGGGLKKVESFFKSEDFFIHNSDVYSTFDLQNALEHHKKEKADATLLVFDRPSKRGLYFDETSQLLGWTGETDLPALPSSSKLLAFSGIHIASPRIFEFMPGKDVFSILQPYVACARKGGLVQGHVPQGGEWVDIGTPEHLSALQARFQ